MQVLREGPLKITRSVIDAAWRRRSNSQRLVVSDAECRGLALVVNATSMSWTYSYKPRGTNPLTGKRFASQSITIGNPETHAPDDARREANQHKGANKIGKDPATERKTAINAAASKHSRATGVIFDLYRSALPRRRNLRGHGSLSPRHVAGELANAEAALREMNCINKPVDEITAVDIRRMLEASATKPAAAKHRFGALSRFFDWAQDQGSLAANPCLLIAKPSRPRAVPARERFLTLPELAKLWSAAEAAPGLHPVHRDLVRFLIAIPCRRGEAAAMDWSHVNLDAAIWSQPAHMTKNREAHRLHLHPLALCILKRRQSEAGNPSHGLVFPSPRAGTQIQTFSDIIEHMQAAAPGTPDWSFHDFRRSFATALGEAGVPETVADAVLNHRQSGTRGGVLGVYQRAQRWPEQLTAMSVWGDKLETAVTIEARQGRARGSRA